MAGNVISSVVNDPSKEKRDSKSKARSYKPNGSTTVPVGGTLQYCSTSTTVVLQ